MNDHDALENSVAAFVLSACDPEEAEEVRAHLQACASCRELSARLSRAINAIPLATDELRPPARLRERILEAARATPHATQAAAPPRRKIVWLPRARRMPGWAGWRRGMPAAAVAVLAVAVLGLAGWNVVLTQQLSQAQAAHYTLSGSGSMAASKATVTAFRRDGVTVVDFTGMPQTDAGKVYQLWLIDQAGHAASAGVFRPEPDGTKTLVLNRDLSGYAKLAVTIEDGPDGARAPSQAPQLGGQIA